MSDHQAAYPTTTMCELLGVSSSGYYAWIKRRPSRRAETDTMLIAEIHVAHEASRGTYGAPRIHTELAAKGLRVGRKRIAQLMARARLAGVSRRRFVATTVRNGGRQAPNLVKRNFTAEAPDRLWVADITYIPTWAGFLYLAVVLDAYSRCIVGWSMMGADAHPGRLRGQERQDARNVDQSPGWSHQTRPEDRPARMIEVLQENDPVCRRCNGGVESRGRPCNRDRRFHN